MEVQNLLKMRDKIFKCMGCGVCRGIWEKKDEAICPVWATGIGFEDSVPRGRVTVAQDILDGFLTYSLPLAESVYRCTDCGSCVAICDSKDSETGYPVIDVPEIVRTMKMDLVENSLVPPLVRDYFKAVHVNDNPYKEPREGRGKWAEGIGIEMYSGQEFLFYVGDVGSYDERGKRMAKSVARLLSMAGVSMGILGPEEIGDGNDVRALGESGLFVYLAERNIAMFRELGIKKIISLDPHSFNAFRKFYPEMGGDFQVWHYTQILADAFKEGRLPAVSSGRTVTYHDPCYLGRHNEVYEPARDLLRGVSDLRLVEMRRFGKNSLCCGGGGGNFFTDLVGGGVNSPSRIRVREAVGTGSEILAVACPLCSKMLDDAVKAENLEDRLAVKDVSEIILDAM
jgi:Fe-S oxidoreductase